MAPQISVNFLFGSTKNFKIGQFYMYLATFNKNYPILMLQLLSGGINCFDFSKFFQGAEPPTPTPRGATSGPYSYRVW